MTDFVLLAFKRNRGWPWPEDSWGLEPMFGRDGWCGSCGTPRGPQTGSLVLPGGGMVAEGVWMPNWRFDVICVAGWVASEIVERFDVDLRPVTWRGRASPGDASQIVVPSSAEAWFDPVELRDVAEARHGRAGATCPECGVWRWMPLVENMVPRVQVSSSWAGADIMASREWFGDGMRSFRQILMRRELAETLAAAGPKDARVQELDPAPTYRSG